MKTLLTCDEVFESLTAGPIAAGTDTQLQGHLETCQTCGELAEALRPATHLIHEALPSELRAGLPTYLAPDEVKVNKILMQIDKLPRSTVPATRRRQSVGLLLAFAACIVMLLCWRHNSAGDSSLNAGELSLSQLGLPLACSVSTAASNADWAAPKPSPSTNSYACCTSCHTASPTNSQRVQDMRLLVAACGNCH